MSLLLLIGMRFNSDDLVYQERMVKISVPEKRLPMGLTSYRLLNVVKNRPATGFRIHFLSAPMGTVMIGMVTKKNL